MSENGVNHSTEATSLLKPSAHSTLRPSAENVTDLEGESASRALLNNNDNDVDHSSKSEAKLLSFQHQSHKDYGLEFWGKNFRRQRQLIIAGCLAGFCAALALVFYFSHKHHEKELPLQPWEHQIRHLDLRAPLSLSHPSRDLGLADVLRPSDSRPASVLTAASHTDNRTTAYPTNAWYQNFLRLEDHEEPANKHRVYVIPYVADAAGPMPGLRVHPNHITSSVEVVETNIVEEFGLTVGAAVATKQKSASRKHVSHRYTIKNMTELGITLGWDAYPMTSSIVKGMPYSTMVFHAMENTNDNGDVMLPTVASQIALLNDPTVDRKTSVKCTGNGTEPFLVEREIEATYKDSDFTWLIFYSKPVYVKCVEASPTSDAAPEDSGMFFQVVGTPKSSSSSSDDKDTDPLVIRVAMFKQCTTGISPIYCHQERMHPTALLVGQGDYGELLRTHAHMYPGPNTQFSYSVSKNSPDMYISFDWDVQTLSNRFGVKTYGNRTVHELIMFALPHHIDMFQPPKYAGIGEIYCAASLVGPACLVEGSQWTLVEKIPDVDLRAPRPPAPWALEELAKSLKEDLRFTLPHYFQRGAGDTYFSGKMLAKLARILLVAEEVNEICSHSSALASSSDSDDEEYAKVCKDLTLPGKQDMDQAVAALRSSVEVWINGTAETPFIFDSAWGGVISCGCDFQKHGCANKYPDCPAFDIPGLNFGNAFYNDCHFHYGYHIYAAAVASHFDPIWAKENFENVLLLIRSIANPSKDDRSFPTWRHKDWYQGHSWASGISGPVYVNGKNQESSSEAIAAYEAISLYGRVMESVWNQENSKKRVEQAERIRWAGEVLAATEVRAAHSYWHNTMNKNEVKIYPSTYGSYVVGILWQMMAQFQTWFGKAPYLMYGIQLLPLTPISELRDNIEWANLAYAPLAKSCEADDECSKSGWGIQQVGLLATVGYPKSAMAKVLSMPKDAFDGPAGNGHSLSNTLWYISTRPAIEEPISLAKPSFYPRPPDKKHPESSENVVIDCFQPDTCTDYVLDTIAGLYTCRQRIQWLMQYRGRSQEDACAAIAGIENPKQCGKCNPYGVDDTGEQKLPDRCPPCTLEQCDSDLNRCPVYPRTYVCYEGPSAGGCAEFPWGLDDGQCLECCELTNCPKSKNPTGSTSHNKSSHHEQTSMDCPPCSKKVCKSRLNQCPSNGESPYLCYKGASAGGCSPEPWAINVKQCEKCCTIEQGCEE